MIEDGSSFGTGGAFQADDDELLVRQAFIKRTANTLSFSPISQRSCDE